MQLRKGQIQRVETVKLFSVNRTEQRATKRFTGSDVTTMRYAIPKKRWTKSGKVLIGLHYMEMIELSGTF